MPSHLPTLAQTFRDAGYLAYAVGKLHVYPQRNRIGFDDVALGEEGRAMFGLVDDYELYLGERGYPGEYFTHGMGNNEYVTRPWHLPEEHHVTNWATREMVRVIKRRDPTRPALWYLSYCHPHPPLVPLQVYLDIYREMQIDAPSMGEWADDPESLPYRLRAVRDFGELRTDREIRQARRAFYALCTHIDHQLRVVIGTLREEGVLDNTTIVFASDHGDLLGKHGLWRKSLFYEDSARVPMIVLGTEGDERVGFRSGGRSTRRPPGCDAYRPRSGGCAGPRFGGGTVDGGRRAPRPSLRRMRRRRRGEPDDLRRQIQVHLLCRRQPLTVVRSRR